MNEYLVLGLAQLLLDVVDFPVLDVYLILQFTDLVFQLVDLRLVLFEIRHELAVDGFEVPDLVSQLRDYHLLRGLRLLTARRLALIVLRLAIAAR